MVTSDRPMLTTSIGPGCRVLGFRHEDRRQDQQQHQHRDGHQEGRAPPVVLQQEPADDRAERGAAGEAGRPDGDGQPALLTVDEHVAQQRQCGRHQHGAEEAERRAGGDERLGDWCVGGDAPRRRRSRRSRSAAAGDGRRGRRGCPSRRAGRPAPAGRCRSSTAAGCRSGSAPAEIDGSAKLSTVASTATSSTGSSRTASAIHSRAPAAGGDGRRRWVGQAGPIGARG